MSETSPIDPSKAQPTVYVMGGFRAAGGAIMAYEVAQIAARIMNARVTVCDHPGKPSKPFEGFEYSGPAEFCDVETFVREHRRDDLLVINPSLQAALYSLQLDCRIVSYVQGYTTFWHLDPKIDLFVAVSRFVAQHIKHNDQVDAPVIPPFLPGPLGKPQFSYLDKPDAGWINLKGVEGKSPAIHDFMTRRSRTYRDLRLQTRGGRVTLMDQLDRSRIFFTGAISEGFGLLPLEAMYYGCITVGLDGHGGADYMRHGENGFCLPFQRVDELPSQLDAVMDRLDDWQHVSDEARRTAAGFTYDRFAEHWAAVLRPFL